MNGCQLCPIHCLFCATADSHLTSVSTLPNSFAVLWTAACHVALHRQSRHIVNSCLIFTLFSRLRAVVSVSAQALLTAETGGNRDSMVRLLFSDKC